MSMSEPAFICPLQDLGALQFSGPEAHNFLQGQVSNDLTRLAPGRDFARGFAQPPGPRARAVVACRALGQRSARALAPRARARHGRASAPLPVAREAHAQRCERAIPRLRDRHRRCRARLAASVALRAQPPLADPAPARARAPWGADEPRAMARAGYRGGHPAGLRANLGTVCRSDAQSGLHRCDLVQQRLLHRSGSDCPRALPRPREAASATLRDDFVPAASAPAMSGNSRMGAPCAWSTAWCVPTAAASFWPWRHCPALRTRPRRRERAARRTGSLPARCRCLTSCPTRGRQRTSVCAAAGLCRSPARSRRRCS
jgi:hypothetical protein